MSDTDNSKIWFNVYRVEPLFFLFFIKLVIDKTFHIMIYLPILVLFDSR